MGTQSSTFILATVTKVTTVMAAPFVETALEVLSRATSTSEVLTLNLTGLLILAALKIAVIVFGMTSGASLLGFTGRSASSQGGGVSSNEMTGGLCFLLYTSGEQDRLSCVQRSACEEPSSAKELLAAAKLWRKMHSVIQAVPYSSSYSRVVEAVQTAARTGENREDCSVYAW